MNLLITKEKRRQKLVLEEDYFNNKFINKKLSAYSINEELKQNQKLNQKLSLHVLQKHLSILKLEEFLLILTFITAGILGRILLQGFSSVEPITFFAILAGSLFGWRKGAITGASSWYLSNFFMFGGQGPWTLIHVANGLIAGFLGGVFLKKPNYTKTIMVMIVSTLIFELTINLMSGLLFFGIIISFITAIPFMITHLVSTVGFAFLLPKTRKTVLEKGKLNEKELCNQLIKKLKQKKVSNHDS